MRARSPSHSLARPLRSKIHFLEVLKKHTGMLSNKTSDPSGWTKDYSNWVADNAAEFSRDKNRDMPVFTHHGANGNMELVEMFGQMPPEHLSPETVMRIAESIIGGSYGTSSHEMHNYHLLTNLLTKIESESYNRLWFEEIIAANERFSLNGAGEFVGEQTPAAAKQAWGTSLTEWAPNAYGSLRLPKTATARQFSVPAGFANGPGLQTLAAEATDPTSPWFELGKEAKRALESVEKLVAVVGRAVPATQVSSPTHQSPWFHRPSATTTFIESLVARRDPIWLARLAPTSTGQGLAAGVAPGQAAPQSSIKLGSVTVNVQAGTASVGGFTTNSNVILPASARFQLLLSPDSLARYGTLSDDDKAIVMRLGLHLACIDPVNGVSKARYLVNLAATPGSGIGSAELTRFQDVYTGKKSTERNMRLRELEKALTPPSGKSLPDATPNPAALNAGLDRVLETAITTKTAAGGATNLAAAVDAFYASLTPGEFVQVGPGGQIVSPAGTLTDAVNAALTASGAAAGTIRTGGGAATAGQFASESILGYYRSPLTMTMLMLDGVFKEGKPLILPSDPETCHTSPWSGSGQVPAHIWSGESYKLLGLLIGDEAHKHRELRNVPYIARHLQDPGMFQSSGEPIEPVGQKRRSTDSASSGAAARSAKRKPIIFADESDPDESAPEYDTMDTAEIGHPIMAGMWTDPLTAPRTHEEFCPVLTETFENQFEAVHKTIRDPILRAVALAFLHTPCNGHTIIALAQADALVPLNIILWRLWIEHDMSTYIMLKSGLSTGANVTGHADFRHGHDVVSKIMYGNFTFYSKAMVWKPRHVYLLENVKPDGYVGGMNSKFFCSSDEVREMTTMGTQRRSFIATVVPIEEDDYQLAMSFTGLFCSSVQPVLTLALRQVAHQRRQRDDRRPHARVLHECPVLQPLVRRRGHDGTAHHRHGELHGSRRAPQRHCAARSLVELQHRHELVRQGPRLPGSPQASRQRARRCPGLGRPRQVPHAQGAPQLEPVPTGVDAQLFLFAIDKHSRCSTISQPTTMRHPTYYHTDTMDQIWMLCNRRDESGPSYAWKKHELYWKTPCLSCNGTSEIMVTKGRDDKFPPRGKPLCESCTPKPLQIARSSGRDGDCSRGMLAFLALGTLMRASVQ